MLGKYVTYGGTRTESKPVLCGKVSYTKKRLRILVTHSVSCTKAACVRNNIICQWIRECMHNRKTRDTLVKLYINWIARMKSTQTRHEESSRTVEMNKFIYSRVFQEKINERNLQTYKYIQITLREEKVGKSFHDYNAIL